MFIQRDQRKHKSSASLAFVRGIHRWPVNSPHKGPVTRKMFSFDDVIDISCVADESKYTGYTYNCSGIWVNCSECRSSWDWLQFLSFSKDRWLSLVQLKMRAHCFSMVCARQLEKVYISAIHYCNEHWQTREGDELFQDKQKDAIGIVANEKCEKQYTLGPKRNGRHFAATL